MGRTDVEAEAPMLWPPDAKSWLIEKDPDAGKDWRQEERWATEDEMVGWRHWLNGHEFEQTPGDGEGLGSLACYSPCGHKESDRTDRLNNNNPFSNHIILWVFFLSPEIAFRVLFMGFPGGADSKESACNTGDLGSIPGSGRSPGGGHGNPLQYSCLENSMDRDTGKLQSMGLQRVGRNWVTNTLTFSLLISV